MSIRVKIWICYTYKARANKPRRPRNTLHVVVVAPLAVDDVEEVEPELEVDPELPPEVELAFVGDAVVLHTNEVDRTRLWEIGQVKPVALVWMLTPPRTRVRAGSSTVLKVPVRSTACTVVRAGKSMSLSWVLLATWKPETVWRLGIEMFMSAVLLVMNRSPVIVVRLFAWIIDSVVC